MLHKSPVKTLLVVFVFAAGSTSLRASSDDDHDNGAAVFDKLLDRLERKNNALAFDDAEIIFEQNATDGYSRHLRWWWDFSR